jgi:flagellar biosynthesis GTPase FlhF
LATTKQRKAHFICESAQLDSEQPLKIYVPKKEIIEEFRPDNSDNSKMGKIQRFNIGRPNDGKESQNIKTIMMFGRTGHGKTTMISAMLNYLYEVSFYSQNLVL